MADEKSKENQESRHTLTDDQIKTERTLRRRSFLTAAGALVAGGAVALAFGPRADALAQATDPDQKKSMDPDMKKHMHHAKKRMHHEKKHMRHEMKKHMRHDPDQKKPPSSDPGR